MKSKYLIAKTVLKLFIIKAHSPDQQNKNGGMYKVDALVDGVREEKLSLPFNILLASLRIKLT